MEVELNFRSKFNLAKICLEVLLAFVRSGYIYLDHGAIADTGNGVGYRSRTAWFAEQSYLLLSDTTYVYPSSYGQRWVGRPLRCLYPGSA